MASQTLRRATLLAFVAGMVLAAVALFPTQGAADTSIADLAIARTSSRLDYAVPASVVPAIGRASAATAARAFAGGNAVTIRQVRLARYANLQQSGMLVWVVELDGLNWRGLGGGPSAPLETRPLIARAAVLVSAADGHVEAMYTTVPGQ